MVARVEMGCLKEVERVAIDLPLEAESARRARTAIAPLQPYVDVASFDEARLLVSELVSDAVTSESPPAKRAISMRAEVLRGPTRVAVAFDDLPVRIPGRKPELGEPGWGVYLVQRLATRWGARHDGTSTSVWFEA